MPLKFNQFTDDKLEFQTTGDSKNGFTGSQTPQSVKNAALQQTAKPASQNPFTGIIDRFNVSPVVQQSYLATANRPKLAPAMVTQAPEEGGEPLQPGQPPGQPPPPGQTPPPSPTPGPSNLPPPGAHPYSTAQEYAQFLGQGWEWVAGRQDLIDDFLNFTQVAAFGSGTPEEFKAYLWAFGLDPNQQGNEYLQNMSLAEIYSRYPGQEWLRGRDDILWYWQHDPQGKAAGTEFTQWMNGKGYNAQTPRLPFPGEQEQGGPSGPGELWGVKPGTRPGQWPTAPTPPQGPPGTQPPGTGAPGGPGGPENDYLKRLQDAIRGIYAEKRGEGIRALQAQGAYTGDLNTGGFGVNLGDFLTDLGSMEARDIAQPLFEFSESGLDRELQRYLGGLGLEGTKYAADKGLLGAQAHAQAAAAGASAQAAASRYGSDVDRYRAQLGYDTDMARLGYDMTRSDRDFMMGMLDLIMKADPQYFFTNILPNLPTGSFVFG